jgi:hypothetical protein
VPLCVERCGDLTVGKTSATQLDDASDGSLFRLGRPDVALASLAGGCLAERVVAYRFAASGGLREAASRRRFATILQSSLAKTPMT